MSGAAGGAAKFLATTAARAAKNSPARTRPVALPTIRKGKYPMAVYVDDEVDYGAQVPASLARKLGTRWCHLLADSEKELLEFAAKIGLRAEWIQHKQDPALTHFDLVPARRRAAVRLGAEELDTIECIRRARDARRNSGKPA